ncbi:MAG: hydrogenase nickel incorporation protein HypB [Bryobacterales bacterium]
MSAVVYEPIAKKVLSENDRVAARLREQFREQGVLTLNLISSPGAGKTALLERTLELWPPGGRVGVLTGDIQTDNDARRLAAFGYPVKQICSGGACHLDARMVEQALEGWDLSDFDVLFLENVGNLVCPTSYDLGEEAKVVVLSVTEGDDKPLKYPGIFHKAELMLLNKIDLLPYVPFRVDAAEANARSVHADIDIIQTSALTGAGLPAWFDWLGARRRTQS